MSFRLYNGPAHRCRATAGVKSGDGQRFVPSNTFFYLNQIGLSKGLPINSRFLPNDRPTRSMYTIMSIIKKKKEQYLVSK